MSSDLIARVQALHDKAEELADKGHLLRAAENYVLAAEVARSLGPDNLVSVYMLLRQGATGAWRKQDEGSQLGKGWRGAARRCLAGRR